MRYPKLKGKRYIGLVRCSTLGQADTSIDDQLVVLAAFAKEHEMVHVDNVMLEGVSGSLPGNRTDIDQLVTRKRNQDDFDVLLVHDTTRLTRGGPKHGAKLEYDLEAAGVETVFVADNLPEGDFADIYKSILYFSGKQQAKSISLTSARGSMSSLLQGRSAYCRRPPYGIDRLYLSPEGKPLHIIRNLPDGTQVKLDPDSREIIGRFGRNETHGIPRHYIKQKDERVMLIPGANDQVAVVHQIFKRYHLKNWGYFRIAQELNDQGISSPSNKDWTVAVVRQILLNPIYIGLGIANRFTNAIYHMRAPETPQAVQVDTQILTAGKRPPRKIRARKEWHEQRQPRLHDFLDDAIRPLATRKQAQYLDNLADNQRPAANKDRHRESPFLLKNLLTSKQGGYPMTGRHTGRNTSRKRYYAVSRAFAAPTRDKTLRKMIPAEPIEKAVLGILMVILRDAPYIRERIQKAIHRRYRQAQTDNNNLAELQAQKSAIQRKLEFIIDELDELGRDVVKNKTQKLQARLKAVEERIQQGQTTKPVSQNDMEAAVDKIIDRLVHLSVDLNHLPLAAVRRLLECVIQKAEVDLETRRIEMEFRLPSWAFKADGSMCLDDTFACKCNNEAHPENGVLLMKMRFMWWPPFRDFCGYDFAA